MKTKRKIIVNAATIVLLSFLFLPVKIVAQDFKIRGRLHMDAIYGINDADQFSNGFNNRRARMGMTGNITENWNGLIEIDFADGGVAPNDVRLRRTFSNGSRLEIGQFKVPQGLNELSSSNNITFMERSSPNNVVFDARRIGIAYEAFVSNLGFKTMVYGRALGQRSSLIDDMPMGVALRGFLAPEVGGGQLHIGASVSYEDLMDTTNLRLSDRPEARDSKGGSVRLIDARIPDAKSTFKTGVELLYIIGAFSLEGEFQQVTVNRYIGETPTFYGFHVQMSYVLTGESRSYSKGIVSGISPAGEKGAWEVAARYSFMNLNDEEFTGGEQSNITIGLNYYVTSRLRFMGNVIISNLDYTDDMPVLGLLRAQFNF